MQHGASLIASGNDDDNNDNDNDNGLSRHQRQLINRYQR